MRRRSKQERKQENKKEVAPSLSWKIFYTIQEGLAWSWCRKKRDGRKYEPLDDDVECFPPEDEGLSKVNAEQEGRGAARRCHKCEHEGESLETKKCT